MEIKRKEKVNFSELIKYIYDNDIESGVFYCNGLVGKVSNIVRVDNYCIKFPKDTCISINHTWTIEREKELTKNIKLPTVLVNDGKCFLPYYNITIKDLEKRFTSYVYGIETIHLINDDSTHTLIYKDGALVE